MKELVEFALDSLGNQSIQYGDIRIVEKRSQRIETKNGRVGTIEDYISSGLGVRVLKNGCWGFASTDDLTKEAVYKIIKQAVAIAEASALVKKGEIVLAEEPPYRATWQTPIKIDPFQVSLEMKVELLLKIDEICRKVKGVQTVLGEMGFVRTHQIFANSEGSFIEQTLFLSGAGYSVTAANGNEIQKRSFPASFGGQWSSMGYELIEVWPLLEEAPRVADEAVALLKAKPCPVGEKDLIIDGSQLALQIHESCGHAIELDRVLGYEANFAGTSFLTLDKLGVFQYGSNIVNIVADATLEHGPGAGTFGFDDEGVPAQSFDIVREGKLVGYLTSRETAKSIGQARSNGTMRASGWNRIPLIRMTNVSLLPGDWTLEDLIADTKDGLYLQTNRSWSIDDQRFNFQFGTEIGWEIKNGKLGEMIKNPTYEGTTPQFWQSCDAICSRDYWTLWGVPNCGKGQPMQVMPTGHGAAPARFRKIKIGISS